MAAVAALDPALDSARAAMGREVRDCKSFVMLVRSDCRCGAITIFVAVLRIAVRIAVSAHSPCQVHSKIVSIGRYRCRYRCVVRFEVRGRGSEGMLSRLEACFEVRRFEALRYR